jgi:hypothetical protein
MVEKIIGAIFLIASGFLFSIEGDYTVFVILFVILGFYYLGKKRFKKYNEK